MALNKDFIVKNDLTLGGTISKINGLTLTNGQILVGSTTTGKMVVTTLTGSSAVTVTNGAGSIALDLSDTGIAAGMYSHITVDTKGRATSGKPSANSFSQAFVGAVAQTSGTTLIPYDTTPPLSSEGTQIWSQTITPAATSSRVKIDCAGMVDCGTASRTVTVAVFRGTTFIGAVSVLCSATPSISPFSIMIVDSPATTAATTYSCRIGVSTNATWYLGRGATATFGGTNPTGWSLVEVLA